MNKEKYNDDIIVDVSEIEYQKDLARGFHEDEVMKPGRHRFKRGGFLKRHCTDTEPGKIRISVEIDLDLLSYFKERASGPDLYKTEFNKILRELIDT